MDMGEACQSGQQSRAEQKWQDQSIVALCHGPVSARQAALALHPAAILLSKGVILPAHLWSVTDKERGD